MLNYDRISQKSLMGYIWIMVSQFVSLIGSQIVSFAVIWYLTIETGSTVILTTASVANIVPMILISPIAGVIADRVNKNALMIFSDMAQALATLGLIILFQLGIAQIWHIIALMAVRGVSQGIQMPVASTVVSLMVPEEHIKKINSIQQIFNSLLGIAAPAIGAIAIANFTIQQIYWLDVFTFVPTAIVLMLIRIPKANRPILPEAQAEQKASGFWADFREGFIYIKQSKLWSVFAMFGLANFIVVPVFSLFPLLILDRHFGTAAQYSWVEVLFQAGLILGAFILMASKRQPSMKGVIWAGILLSAVLLFLGLVPAGWFWLLYIGCFILGVNLAFIDTQLMSVLQLKIPKQIQGRVFSSMFVVIKALNPLGLILWGLIGEYMAVYLIFITASAISLVVYFILTQITDILHWGDHNFVVEGGEVHESATEIVPISEEPAIPENPVAEA